MADRRLNLLLAAVCSGGELPILQGCQRLESLPACVFLLTSAPREDGRPARPAQGRERSFPPIR